MLLITNDLPAEYRIAATLDKRGFAGDEKVYVVTSPYELFFVEKCAALLPDEADEPGYDVYQAGFPREAARWIVDAIEEWFGCLSPELEGPSNTYHFQGTIGGERLLLQCSGKAGRRGKRQIITLRNMSRPGLRFRWENFQEFQLTDRLLLQGGLLDTLKGIDT